MENEHQRPEGALIERAAKAMGISGRKAASLVGISDARWRQIVNGYQSVGAGQVATVVGPDETVARMAQVVGVTSEQLREAGRPEAAELLLVLSGVKAQQDWQRVGTTLDRLINMRDELNVIIEELSRSGGDSGGDTAAIAE